MSGYGYGGPPSKPYPLSSRPPFPPRSGGQPQPSYLPGDLYAANEYDRKPDPYQPYSPPAPSSSYRTPSSSSYAPPTTSSVYDYPSYTSDHAYPQPARPYGGSYGAQEQDQYDPYHPTTESQAPAYRPYSPPPPARKSPPPRHRDPPARDPPTRSYHSRPPSERTDSKAQPDETYLLTPPTWSIIAGAMTYIHQLPSSHLPLVKYVATSKSEAVALHRRLLSRANASFWYTDGSLRGGECWSAAIEWKMPQGTSGKKMRECIGEGDALDAELGGLRKATQAFLEDLPNRFSEPPELIIFSDSQAAIVSLDTSTRPESRKFCELYEGVLQRFPSTRITLVWIPGHHGIEGNELADKIAVVGATNSYLKRKKQGSLNYIYRAGPDSETLPGASTQPGTWQTGSADPRAPTFKPEPVPPPPPPQTNVQSAPYGTLPHAPVLYGQQDPYPEMPPFPPSRSLVDIPAFVPPLTIPPVPIPPKNLPSEPTVTPPPALAPPQSNIPTPPIDSPRQKAVPAADASAPDAADKDDEGLEAKEGSLFVTNFPEGATAKDIGILFGQFGSIIAVDIFSIPPIEPRFALVSFTDPSTSGPAAISALDRKPISFETSWAQEHAEDLAIWKGWDGTLVVVPSEGGTLVPRVVAAMFPELPEWAISGGTVDAQVHAEQEGDKKRSRSATEEQTASNGSPRKRPRISTPDAARAENDVPMVAESSEAARVKVETASTPTIISQEEPTSSTVIVVPQASTQVPAPETNEAPATAVLSLPTEAAVSTPPLTLPVVSPVAIVAPTPTVMPKALSPKKPPTVLPPFPPTLGKSPMPPFPPKSVPPVPSPSTPVPANLQPAPLPPTPLSAAVSQVHVPPTATSISPSTITDLASAQPILTELKIIASIRREEIVRIQQMLTRFPPTDWVGQVDYLTEQFSIVRAELGETLKASEDGRKDIKSFEATLLDRGFSRERIEVFVKKVLAVLDGIAQEDADSLGTASSALTSQTDLPTALQLTESLQHTCNSLKAQLDGLTRALPEKTKQMVAPLEALYEGVNEAMISAGRERDEVSRRSLVLQGMLSKGEVVGAVVGFLLSK